MHPTLTRLDRLAEHLAQDPATVGLLGLGSAGLDHQRFDDDSDLDFFVVVADGPTKAALLADVSWLGGLGGDLVHSFVNSPDGRKGLFADGLFVEYAVFSADELPSIAFTGARVVWQRPGVEVATAPDRPVADPGPLDTVEFHLNEALTNLFVGLGRERRGERLSAARFIQVHAVDRVLALARLAGDEGAGRTDGERAADAGGTGAAVSRDPFDATRRVENRSPDLPLAEMMPGYNANAEAASAILSWLRTRHATDPHLTRRIDALVAELGGTR